MTPGNSPPSVGRGLLHRLPYSGWIAYSRWKLLRVPAFLSSTSERGSQQQLPASMNHLRFPCAFTLWERKSTCGWTNMFLVKLTLIRHSVNRYNNWLSVTKQSLKLHPPNQIPSTNDRRLNTGASVDSSGSYVKNMLFSGSLTIRCTASGSELMQQSASNLVTECEGRTCSGDSGDNINCLFAASFSTFTTFSENSLPLLSVERKPTKHCQSVVDRLLGRSIIRMVSATIQSAPKSTRKQKYVSLFQSSWSPRIH